MIEAVTTCTEMPARVVAYPAASESCAYIGPKAARRDRRLWRQLVAARLCARGGGGAPSGGASLWECRAARGRQARAGEAQGVSWGPANGVITR